MPTFRHGKNTLVFVNAYDLSEYFTTATTTDEVELAETTTFGASARTYIDGISSGTASVEGLWAGDVNGVDELFAAALASDTSNTLTIGPEGSALGRRAVLLNANDTSYEVTGGIGDLVSTSAEFEASGTIGGINRGVLLASKQTVTATVTNTSVDNGASTTNGGVAHLHVTTNSRNGAVTIKVQHSSDNSTWVDLITFTNTVSSTVTSQRSELAAGTTVNRYLRANVSTFGGSTGSLVMTVGFARR